MTQSPAFAVVGHPNKGKSSVVATLSQNDAIAIALEPGTTRRQQHYPLTVDGQRLYTLIDTPGFQRPRRVLQWLEAHSVSAADRPQTVQAFVTQHRDDDRFVDECELLAPILAGAGIIYVVDGSVPYSAEHEAEMTILRWTGRPSLALINSIGEDDYADQWQAALTQFFQVVRRFDAVRAPFEQHLSLLRAFGQLEPDWEAPLERATRHLEQQRQERRHQAAERIARALMTMMGHQERQRLVGDGSRTDLETRLRERWYQHQRSHEERLRRDIEHLYQHERIERQEAALRWHHDHDLFSDDSRRLWGVSRRYLATAGFGAGAVSGAGLDAATLGSSFGAGALIGGVLGAAGGYLFGDRLAFPSLSIGSLGNGVKTATFGPAQDLQFGYVVLGRAVDHWWAISRRNHAGRDRLELEPTGNHWLEHLDRTARRDIQKALETGRRGQTPGPRQHHNLTDAVEQAMLAYERWRLNRQ